MVKISSVGYRTDLMLLGWSGSQIIDRGDHLVIKTPQNPGFWWGNFLLLGQPVQPGEADHWRQRFATEFPEAGHLAIGIDGTDGNPGTVDDLLAQGLTLNVNTVLVADRLATTAALNAEIRALTTGQDWDQAYALRRAAADLDDTEANRLFLLRQLRTDRRLVEAGHGRWFGAFVDGRLRSSAGIFADDGIARYQVVQTDPDFRRRGLASQVIQHAGRWAQSEATADKLVIVADPGYHAIDLYRRLGFVDSERVSNLAVQTADFDPKRAVFAV